jgi:UDP-N-acetylglucosamine diphosphorylase/glucosamine-1-phosphate N-acetyltransferase
MITVLFEDQDYQNFLPLTSTRPVFECRSGMFTFLQRAERKYSDSKILLFSREYLAPTLSQRVSHPINKLEQIDDHMLLINGSLIVNEETRRIAEKKLCVGKNVLMLQNNRLAMAYLSEEIAKKYEGELCKPLSKSLPAKLSKECRILNATNLPLMNFPWDLVNQNGTLLRSDYAEMGKQESEGLLDEKAAIYGDKRNVHVGKDSAVEAFSLIDARDGPVFIGNETMVHSGSRLTGPCYIGDKSIIASGLIREGCSLGPVCRVGGEVEETIVQGYTNKYHTGFVGHAYVGEWVNLGAATTNSDLKDTYGTVRVETNKKRVDTGSTKVGCFVGDYVKTSIGTQIYTGKKIGVAAHVHGFVTKDVPAFSIWARSLGAKNVELSLDSAVETQKRAFSRRGVKQTSEDIKLLETLFKITAKERKEAGVRKGKFKF